MNIKEKYKKIVIPEMKKVLGYKNDLAVPRIIKVVINTGVGRINDDKQLEIIEKHLALIAGQKPVKRLAKKSIASFKVRQGMLVGYSVTLRGQRMFDFLDRMVSTAIPRIADFRGLNPKAIDGSGNFTIGFKEHTVFPEISEEDIKLIFGFEVTIVTTARKKEEALELFKLFGFPFIKK